MEEIHMTNKIIAIVNDDLGYIFISRDKNILNPVI